MTKQDAAHQGGEGGVHEILREMTLGKKAPEGGNWIGVRKGDSNEKGENKNEEGWEQFARHAELVGRKKGRTLLKSANADEGIEKLKENFHTQK